jgi:hypothetical protein
MIRNTPYVREDAALFAAIASDAGYRPLLLPPVIFEPPLDGVAQGLVSFDDVVSDSGIDLSAPTDNHPYFFQFDRGIPDNLHPLLLAIVISGVIGVVLLELALRGESSLEVRGMMVYFALLGIGFIAVEVVVIQQTRLILGHPTFAVTLVLTTLLSGAGIGSGLVRRMGSQRLMLPSIFVAVILIVWFVLWPAISNAIFAQSQWIRGLVVGLSLLPLGIVMGMPFPGGLLFIGQYGEKPVALAWAVNGIMTVTGTVLAVTLSTVLGFNAVIVFATVVYTLAAVVSFMAKHHHTASD